jgi:MULE transposase domain.
VVCDALSINSATPGHRNEFVTLADLRRIQKDIEAESIRFDRDDGRSTAKWAEELRQKGHLLAYKSRSCPVPPESGLASDIFCLITQSSWQRAQFQLHGSTVLFIDRTHNTTMYENLTLTTLLVRDKWGHGIVPDSDAHHVLTRKYPGIPVAWMLASNGTQETLTYFLKLICQANPGVTPHWIMTDRDIAQINACRQQYPGSAILLCWWHVLHAWQQHFIISQHPILWEKLKAWIRVTDEAEFSTYWNVIMTLAPLNFIDYLQEYWMPVKFIKMWSAVHRANRTILEQSDTNMLVEASVPISHLQLQVKYQCL